MAGYECVGERLPGDLLLGDSSLKDATAVASAFAGEAGGKQFFFFECTLGRGRGATHRSVFAVRGPRDTFGAERFDPGLVVESCGLWTLIYRERSLFEPEEIQAFIAGL